VDLGRDGGILGLESVGSGVGKKRRRFIESRATIVEDTRRRGEIEPARLCHVLE